jgi:hypothetical protein
LKSNWKDKDVEETFEKLLNGCLHPEGIQAISDHCNRMIILIYLESATV